MKSQNLRLIAGDKNTSFFHKQYRARPSHNHTSEITSSSGESFKGITHLKQEAEAHFKKLFTKEGVVESELTSNFLSNVPSMVNAEDNGELMKPFSEAEIIDVIWSMAPDKAPVPDSFSIHFYRVC